MRMISVLGLVSVLKEDEVSKMQMIGILNSYGPWNTTLMTCECFVVQLPLKNLLSFNEFLPEILNKYLKANISFNF